MEVNEYKYLVDVCELADDVSILCESGCSPDGFVFRYTITVRHTTKAVRNTFYNMVTRKEDDILYCLNHYVNRVLELVNLGNFDPIHNTFDLDFIGTEYSLDSEFAKGLKRINSLDDIEKSHVDEPGERGEKGVVPALNGKMPVEVNLCDIFESYEEYLYIEKKLIIRAKSSQKAIEFLKSVMKNKASCEWFVSIPGHISYYKLLNIYNSEGYIRLVLETLPWLEVGRVLFSVPTLAGPRGTKPLQYGMLTYTDTADAGSKDEIVCTKQKSLSETLLEMSPAVKSAIERDMDLIQRCKIHSDLFEREEAPKFPQMRRARLNKPKSI